MDLPNLWPDNLGRELFNESFIQQFGHNDFSWTDDLTTITPPPDNTDWVTACDDQDTKNNEDPMLTGFLNGTSPIPSSMLDPDVVDFELFGSNSFLLGDDITFEHSTDFTSIDNPVDPASVAADHSYTRKEQNLGLDTPPESEGDRNLKNIYMKDVNILPEPCVTLELNKEEISEDSTDYIDVESLEPMSPSYEVQKNVQSVNVEPPKRSLRPSQRMPVQRPTVGKKHLVPPSNVLAALPSRKRGRGYGRRGRRKNTESDSDPDVPDLERRSIHNDMERQRRIGLKNLFDELKQLIPSTKNKDRVPKVTILQEATLLCNQITESRDQALKALKRLRNHRNELCVRFGKLEAGRVHKRRY